MNKMHTVKLESRSLGRVGSPPLIIMHWLLGSSRNWLGAGKLLSEYFDVYILDIRNHGNSSHADSMNYQEMADDLVRWLGDKNIDQFYLLGHSLGGKIAMAYACRYPERLLGLIVEDVAPKEYVLNYDREFEAMNSLNLESINTRTDADEMLKAKIRHYEWRQFILSNLVRGEDNKFYWQINLKILTELLPEIMKNPLKEDDKYEGPTLFLRGADSKFMDDKDYPAIRGYFPNSKVVVIEKSGHNVHVENTEGLIKAMNMFKEDVQFVPSK